jgi:hypothetical protein
MRSATLLAVLLFVASTLNAKKITTFDVPNARETIPTAISSSGEIVGIYVDAKSVSHGFLRDHNGKISTIDVPNEVGTHPTAVNSGVIVGYYDVANPPYPGLSKPGFIRSVNGAFTEIIPTIDFTNSVFPAAINSAGETVGYFVDVTGQAAGFVRSPDDGSISVFYLGFPTIINAINSAGEYIGLRSNQFGYFDGFLQQPNEVNPTFFDIPNAFDTGPEAINNKGQIAGSCLILNNGSGHSHGFVRDVDGTITLVDVPGATDTGIAGIDSKGEVVGYYVDSGGNAHGFVQKASGTTTTIDVPGSTDTSVVAINPSGEIVGMFLDSKANIHGFVLKAHRFRPQFGNAEVSRF